MARCAHIYDSGIRCVDETVRSTARCGSHQKVVAFDTLARSPFRKAVVRLLAFALMLLVLARIYYTIRIAYTMPKVEAQEAT